MLWDVSCIELKLEADVIMFVVTGFVVVVMLSEV